MDPFELAGVFFGAPSSDYSKLCRALAIIDAAIGLHDQLKSREAYLRARTALQNAHGLHPWELEAIADDVGSVIDVAIMRGNTEISRLIKRDGYYGGNL
jgi:hypothetical protein